MPKFLTEVDVYEADGTIRVPTDGDVRNATSVELPFQQISNRTKNLDTRTTQNTSDITALRTELNQRLGYTMRRQGQFYDPMYETTEDQFVFRFNEVGSDFDPTSPVLVAGGELLSGGTLSYAIFRSIDLGASWVKATIVAGQGASELGFRSPHYNSGVWLVAGNDGLVYRSTDDGVTFTKFVALSGAMRWVQQGFGTWVASGDNGVARSTDGGQNWTTVSGTDVGQIAHGSGGEWFTSNGQYSSNGFTSFSTPGTPGSGAGRVFYNPVTATWYFFEHGGGFGTPGTLINIWTASDPSSSSNWTDTASINGPHEFGQVRACVFDASGLGYAVGIVAGAGVGADSDHGFFAVQEAVDGDFVSFGMGARFPHGVVLSDSDLTEPFRSRFTVTGEEVSADIGTVTAADQRPFSYITSPMAP